MYLACRNERKQKQLPGIMSKKLTANSSTAEAFALCGIELLMSLPPAVSQSSLKLIADWLSRELLEDNVISMALVCRC